MWGELIDKQLTNIPRQIIFAGHCLLKDSQQLIRMLNINTPALKKHSKVSWWFITTAVTTTSTTTITSTTTATSSFSTLLDLPLVLILILLLLMLLLILLLLVLLLMILLLLLLLLVLLLNRCYNYLDYSNHCYY